MATGVKAEASVFEGLWVPREYGRRKACDPKFLHCHYEIVGLDRTTQCCADRGFLQQKPRCDVETVSCKAIRTSDQCAVFWPRHVELELCDQLYLALSLECWRLCETQPASPQRRVSTDGERVWRAVKPFVAVQQMAEFKESCARMASDPCA